MVILSSLVRFATNSTSVPCMLSHIDNCASVSSMLTCCYSRSAGAWNLEATSCVSNDAKLHAQQELEGRTGDTDSEAEASE